MTLDSLYFGLEYWVIFYYLLDLLISPGLRWLLDFPYVGLVVLLGLPGGSELLFEVTTTVHREQRMRLLVLLFVGEHGLDMLFLSLDVNGSLSRPLVAVDLQLRVRTPPVFYHIVRLEFHWLCN